jgi:hypothetical protein
LMNYTPAEIIRSAAPRGGPTSYCALCAGDSL